MAITKINFKQTMSGANTYTASLASKNGGFPLTILASGSKKDGFRAIASRSFDMSIIGIPGVQVDKMLFADTTLKGISDQIIEWLGPNSITR
jgi:hypothetical protein